MGSIRNIQSLVAKTSLALAVAASCRAAETPAPPAATECEASWEIRVSGMAAGTSRDTVSFSEGMASFSSVFEPSFPASLAAPSAKRRSSLSPAPGGHSSPSYSDRRSDGSGFSWERTESSLVMSGPSGRRSSPHSGTPSLDSLSITYLPLAQIGATPPGRFIWMTADGPSPSSLSIMDGVLSASEDPPGERRVSISTRDGVPESVTASGKGLFVEARRVSWSCRKK